MKERLMIEPSMASRLTDLEYKISYQDHVIDELNEVVIRQQQQIDQLEKALLRVSDHLKQAAGSGLARADEDVPPPHY